MHLIRLTLASLLILTMLLITRPVYAQFRQAEDSGLRSDTIDFNRESANIEDNSHGDAQSGSQRSLTELDGIMQSALDNYYVPGAALAVTYKGRLVYAKGFGFANLRSRERATETTLFNLASCTKSISTFGILRLADSGRLQLDQSVYDIIGRPEIPPRRLDPRVTQITVRQLLHHSGGWNDDSGFIAVCNEIQNRAPQGIPYSEGVRFLFMTPLDYTPGTQAKYANGQWNLVKYVIECVAQMPYGPFMRRELATIGITDMHNETADEREGEALRYAGNPPRAIAGGPTRTALQPSFGNWMASVIDLAKFITALDRSRLPGISQDSYQQLIAELPPPMVEPDRGGHFGLGLDTVRETPDGTFFTKNGAKAGVHAQIVHLPNGVDYALVFNGGANADGSMFNPLGPAMKSINQVLRNNSQWPKEDLFTRYQ